MATRTPPTPDANPTPVQNPGVGGTSASGPGYRGMFAFWLGGAARPAPSHAVSHWTDAVLRGTRTQTHRTDTLARRTTIRTHLTDSLLAPHGITQVRTHYTDAVLLGSRTRHTYTDAMLLGTRIRTHTTDTSPCNTHTAWHHTDVLCFRTQTRTHKTDTWLVKVRQAGHTTDASLLFLPTAIHKTDTVLRTVVTRWHYTSTVTMITPITGRWASPRTGTRTPAQAVSKDRQQGPGTLYEIGFLLVSRSDRNTPLRGVTPTVKLLKPGGGWVPAVGAIVEVDDGWYNLRPDPADRNVKGEIILMATAPGADTTYTKFDVVVPDPYAIITLAPIERNAIADATLLRAFASAALASPRCILQAARSLLVWNAPKTAPLVVNAEDGTMAWQANVVIDPTIKPIRGMDPLP